MIINVDTEAEGHGSKSNCKQLTGSGNIWRLGTSLMPASPERAAGRNGIDKTSRVPAHPRKLISRLLQK